MTTAREISLYTFYRFHYVLAPLPERYKRYETTAIGCSVVVLMLSNRTVFGVCHSCGIQRSISSRLDRVPNQAARSSARIAHVRRIIFPPTFYTVRSISQRVARYQYHVITTNQSNRSLGSRLRRTNIDHIPYPINDTGSHISYVIAYRPNYGTRWWFVTVTLRPICHLLLIAIDDGCRHCKFGADTHDYIIGIIDRIADIIVLVRNRISKITEQSIEFDLVIHSSCDDV